MNSRNRKLLRCIEALEPRRLLSTVTVNLADALRSVDTNLLGVNMATWDGLIANNGTTSDYTLNSQTQSLVAQAGISAFRIPGGSTADVFQWFMADGGSVDSQASVAALASLIDSVNGVGVVTVNYGTGSPQEAAALLAYLTAPVNDPAIDNITLGMGQINTVATNTSNASTADWTEYNFQTVGFWANLRAATALNDGDPLDFLRVGQTNPFTGIQYWEIGNEEYGSFEVDAHGNSTGTDDLAMPNGDTPKPHDPTTYISFATQFAQLADQIDPSISIGLSVQDPGRNSGFVDPNWTHDILAQSVAQDFTPGFLSDHMYPYGPGSETDSGLLATPDTADPSYITNPYDLAQRAADYQQDLISAFGATTASGIQLLGTEINSVYNDPGKQSVSLVNGLFVADSIGAALETGANGSTGYNGLWVWDLHNGPPSPAGNQSSSLYGWRTGFGDYGMLGTFTNSAQDVPNVQFPDYFAEELASKIIQSGGTVVSAVSDSATLDAFAVLEPNGHLDLLIINKNRPSRAAPNNLPDPSVTETFTFNGFTPSGQSTLYQYGPVQDDAADNAATTYATSLSASTPFLSVSANKFTLAIPDYDMMVLDLAPGSPNFISAAKATFITGLPYTFPITTTGFMTGAITESGSLPPGVTFMPNGDGTATLAGSATVAGTYQFTLSAGNVNQPFTLSVNQTVAFSSTNTATFAVGTLSTFNITTTGFPIGAVAEKGTLPSGLRFVKEPNGGAELIGTPALHTGGTYVLTLSDSNSASSSAQQNFTLVVDQAASFTSAKTTTFTLGAISSFTVTTLGPPIATNLAYTGTLPTGINWSNNGDGTATLSGNPMGPLTGTFPLTLTASNGIQPAATQTFALVVDQPPTIISPATLTLTAGLPAFFLIAATGFPVPTIASAATLPPGLHLMSDGGGIATLYGTPTGSADTYAITFTAANSVDSAATQHFSLTLNHPPTFSSVTTQRTTVGSNFTFTFTTTAFPVATVTELGALPMGLNFVANNDGTATLLGTLDESPTSATYTLHLTAANGVSSAIQTFTLTVSAVGSRAKA